MRYGMRWTQHGKGVFSTLVVLALAAAGAYYLYRTFSVEDAKPSCANLLEGCVQRCRSTTTDNNATEACQGKCEDDNKACVTERAGGK